MRIPLFVVAAVLAIIAAQCTLGVMGRADDADELAIMRVNAVLLTLLWPSAFVLLGLALGMEWRRVVTWAALVLFLAWVVGAGTMQGQYSRGGDFRGVVGF
ncbi:hypothetical protein EON83_02765 [bacterium]|nr:MAG: hypothetical protein EON83_02765 [bacterium]